MKKTLKTVSFILCFCLVMTAVFSTSFAFAKDALELDFKSESSLSSIIGRTGGVVPGDLDGDGRIGMRDSLILKKIAAGHKVAEADERAGDINCDGKITAYDSALIKAHLAGDKDGEIDSRSVQITYSAENNAAKVTVKYPEPKFEIKTGSVIGAEKYPYAVFSYILYGQEEASVVLSGESDSLVLQLSADGVRHSVIFETEFLGDSFDSVVFDAELDSGESVFVDSLIFTQSMGDARAAAAAREEGESVSPSVGYVFDSAAEAGRITAANSAETAFDPSQNAAVLRVSGNAGDPQTNLYFENENISADKYKYVIFTYMVPTSASSDANLTELFLCSGETKTAVAGESVTFSPVKDGAYHTVILPLGELAWWNGDIHMVRIDFFSSCKSGDTMFLDSFAFAASKADAVSFASERALARGISSGLGSTEEGKIMTDGKYESVTFTGAALEGDSDIRFSGSASVVFSKGIKNFNRFKITYSSNSIVRAIAYYDVDGAEKADEFFLENTGGAEKTFTSLILGYFNPSLASRLKMIEFYTINTSSSALSVKSISGEKYAFVPQGTIYLETESYKVGVNLMMGGGINYLEYFKDNSDAYTNLLNNYDVGRLIQQSYYGIDKAPYPMGYWTDRAWGYNPVQGGDKLNNISRIVDFEFTGENEFYVKARPMDWGQVNMATPSYMENIYTLNDSYLKVYNRFVDFSGYTHTVGWQELPAFYTVSALNNFSYYNGGSPWTDGALINRSDLVFWGQVSNQAFELKNTSEFWSAWSDNSGFGVGLYVPEVYTYHAGKFMYNGSTDPADAATNYVAPRKYLTLVCGKPLEYSYLVCAGNLGEIRNTFKENRNIIDNTVLRNYN